MYKVGLFAKNNTARSDNNNLLEFPNKKLRKLPTAADVYQLKNNELADAQKFKNSTAALINSIKTPGFFAAPKPSLRLLAAPKPKPSLGLFAAPKPKPTLNILDMEIKNAPRI
jgi:hypothetical protein